MSEHYKNSGRLWRDALAGAAGGLVASFAMNQFQALWKRASAKLEGQDQVASQENGDDATVKTAEAVSRLVTGRELEPENKKVAGVAVHYGYGTTLGAVYGTLSSLTPVVSSGFGTAYGAAAWLGGDEIAVPMLGLSGPPSETPLSSHASTLAAHLVYGAVTHGVFRLLTRDSRR